MALARRVAGLLGFPFYALDAQGTFHEAVVKYFIEGYAAGITPNPCLVCNRRVRWGFLLDRALTSGAQFLATGHYARLRRAPDGRFQILRAVDPHKDQSCVLYMLTQEQLAHTLFPLGEYTKPQVRRLARRFELPVAYRADSQDLCFIAGQDYRGFLARHAPQVETPGPTVAQDGQRIGQHHGLAFYTIGQRKGLGISAPYPLYVLEKDVRRNTLIVGPRTALGSDELTANQVNWISGEAPSEPFRAQVKIRYKSPFAWATVTPQTESQVHVRFDESLPDITPGQAAVFYAGEVCLGGGIIQHRTPGGDLCPPPH
jgi:tRNA-specific 2-thiouridylase